LHWSPEFSKWPQIAKASALLLLAAIFNKVVFQGDYLILGAVYPEDVVGVYYMAFALSVQPIMLLANNVTGTLFPILSRIKEERERQRDAFIRAARIATLFTVPVSICMAVIAEPLINLLLDAEWRTATPILQFLALGMTLRILEGMTYALLNAQERFHTIALLALVRCIVFVGLAVTLVHWGVEWFAIGIAIAYFIDSLIQIQTALRWSWDSVRSIVRIIGLPILSSSLAAIATIGLYALEWPDTLLWNALAILVAGIIFLVFTVGMTVVFDRSLWAEMKQLKSNVLGRGMTSKTVEAGT
jgi:PST family polysaccharide transporter